MADGFKNFVAGQVLGESDLDDYLMNQAVMRFADAAARNAAIVEVEGNIAYLKDTNTVTVYDGSSWWTLGSATKSLTAGAGFIFQVGTPTFTTTYDEYKIVDGICEWWFSYEVTSAGTAGTAVYVNLPVTADNAPRVIGHGLIFDASVPTVDTGVWETVASFPQRMSFLCSRSTTTYWGATPNLALASGDSIRGHCSFPVDAAG